MDYSNKLNVFFFELFLAIPLMILLDFLLSGKVVSSEAVSVNKFKQQYYNAARNYHYSYEIVTNKNRFIVSKEFAKSIKKNQSIEYSISKLFKEINWCKSMK